MLGLIHPNSVNTLNFHRACFTQLSKCQPKMFFLFSQAQSKPANVYIVQQLKYLATLSNSNSQISLKRQRNSHISQQTLLTFLTLKKSSGYLFENFFNSKDTGCRLLSTGIQMVSTFVNKLRNNTLNNKRWTCQQVQLQDLVWHTAFILFTFYFPFQ